MSLNINSSEIRVNSLSVLEKWFNSHCNGTWENHYGMIIESTDNPGWIITLDDIKADVVELSTVIPILLNKYRVQLNSDGKMVRLYGNNLISTVDAAATFIEWFQARRDAHPVQ